MDAGVGQGRRQWININEGTVYPWASVHCTTGSELRNHRLL